MGISNLDEQWSNSIRNLILFIENLMIKVEPCWQKVVEDVGLRPNRMHL